MAHRFGYPSVVQSLQGVGVSDEPHCALDVAPLATRGTSPRRRGVEALEVQVHFFESADDLPVVAVPEVEVSNAFARRTLLKLLQGVPRDVREHDPTLHRAVRVSLFRSPVDLVSAAARQVDFGSRRMAPPSPRRELGQMPLHRLGDRLPFEAGKRIDEVDVHHRPNAGRRVQL